MESWNVSLLMSGHKCNPTWMRFADDQGQTKRMSILFQELYIYGNGMRTYSGHHGVNKCRVCFATTDAVESGRPFLYMRFISPGPPSLTNKVHMNLSRYLIR